MSKVVTLRMDDGTMDKLDRLSRVTRRTRSWHVMEAVRSYLGSNEWQMTAIERAVRRADRGKARFIEHEKVDQWLATWGTRKEKEPPECE